MSVKTEYQVKELFSLLERIQDLITDITDDAAALTVAKKLRITRRDMEGILGDYADTVHGGNHLMIEKLIYEVTGEVTLFDAPIDTWPQISEAAVNAINEVEWEKYLDEMSK
jgi:hypothetical protein